MKSCNATFTDALMTRDLKNFPGHDHELISSRRVVGRHANQRSVNTDLGDETLAEISSKGATSANIKQGE